MILFLASKIRPFLLSSMNRLLVRLASCCRSLSVTISMVLGFNSFHNKHGKKKTTEIIKLQRQKFERKIVCRGGYP